MSEFSYTITDKYDLAARSALDIIRLAGKYNCRTYVVNNSHVSDISRLFILFGIALKCGDTIKFVAEGADETLAIDKIEQYVSSNM